MNKTKQTFISLFLRVDYQLHVGIVRNSSNWFWLDGTAVPAGQWKLGQPGDVYGLWSTKEAALIAAASGTKQMFGCQVPQASQGSGRICPPEFGGTRVPYI